MHRRVEKKGLSVLEKKVPRNDKYKHIQGNLDTGMNVKKVKFVSVKDFIRRRDEIHYRVSPQMLESLYSEYEGEQHDDGEDIENNGNSSGPIMVTHHSASKPIYDKPYLILDARSQGEFQAGHLLQAYSFPHTDLLRDRLHPKIYEFRNKGDALIIVYCDNEQTSRTACKMMVDRGIDNVFLLTGGLNDFVQRYKGHFIEGAVPDLPKSPERQVEKKYRTTKGSGGLGYYDIAKQEYDELVEKQERRRRGDVEREGDNDDETRSTYSRMSKGTARTAATGRTGLTNATARTNNTNRSNSLSVVKTSPYVSDRVAQALVERRMAQSKEKEQNIRGLLGNLSLHGAGSGGRGVVSSYDDDRKSCDSPQRTARGTNAGRSNHREEERMSTLNSARLREHDRRTRHDRHDERDDTDDHYYAAEDEEGAKGESFGRMAQRERGEKGSPGGNGSGGYERGSPARSHYSQSRYDGRSEAGRESVADSVISRAMSRKGREGRERR